MVHLIVHICYATSTIKFFFFFFLKFKVVEEIKCREMYLNISSLLAGNFSNQFTN